MSEIYSVGQVNTYIKRMFSQDFMLRSISVKGEISNLKYHPSGHIYFSIKDETGTLSCTIWRSVAGKITLKLKDGMQVIATGAVETYEAQSKYQLNVRKIVQDGTGDLHARFEALKQELEEMGMFDKAYKKDLPEYAMKIGVVTASTGAAIQDIINISKRFTNHSVTY